MFYVKIQTKSWFTYSHNFISNSCMLTTYVFIFRADLMFSRWQSLRSEGPTVSPGSSSTALSITPLLLVPPSNAIVPTLSSSSSVSFGKSVVSALPTNSSESESDSEELQFFVAGSCPSRHLRLTPFPFAKDISNFSSFSMNYNFNSSPGWWNLGEAFWYLICIIYSLARPSMLFWGRKFWGSNFF